MTTGECVFLCGEPTALVTVAGHEVCKHCASALIDDEADDFIAGESPGPALGALLDDDELAGMTVLEDGSTIHAPTMCIMCGARSADEEDDFLCTECWFAKFTPEGVTDNTDYTTPAVQMALAAPVVEAKAPAAPAPPVSYIGSVPIIRPAEKVQAATNQQRKRGGTTQ